MTTAARGDARLHTLEGHEFCGAECTIRTADNHWQDILRKQEAELQRQRARAEKLEKALRDVLPWAEDWLAEMRIDKRQSERDGFSSSEMDETEEKATRQISSAKALLAAGGAS